MNIKCTIQIDNLNIGKTSQAINPDNHPESHSFNKYIIKSNPAKHSVTYEFIKFDNLNTLRLTLEDVINQLKFAQDIQDVIIKEK